ncbi:MAG: hypothetical protein JRH11_12450 [Deltaproteobacteria bacterium]|nr:hypothetical protein [Deltaproteobacteria bacterium]
MQSTVHPPLIFGAVALSLALFACGDDGGSAATDSGVVADSGTGGDSATDTGTGGDASTPAACAAAGANCGSVVDESGAAVGCGDCVAPEVCGGDGPNRCGEGTCTPLTCTDVGANCGDASDGCGGTLTCGTCGSGSNCMGGLCIEETPTECDGSPINACGGCATLPRDPGSPCPCSGSVTECILEPWPIGLVWCDDGDFGGTVATTLDATDDGVDEFSTLMGSIDVLALADDSGGYLDQDFDRYEVFVDDTVFGRFEPEIEYVHPGGFSGEICISHGVDNVLGPLWVSCPPEGSGIYSCCMPFDEAATTVAFSVELLGTGALLDNSGIFRIEVKSHGGAAMCADYTVRYRF